jgi:hydrogenase-4 membrane subunit HyfE
MSLITGPVLGNLIETMSVIIVLIALGIISVNAIRQMIRFYQIQSIILALITIVIALEVSTTNLSTSLSLIAFAVVIPAMLAYIIEPLLAQATVPHEMPLYKRFLHPFIRHISWFTGIGLGYLGIEHGEESSSDSVFRLFGYKYIRDETHSVQEATPVWLEHGLPTGRQRGSIVISLLLTAAAYTTSFSFLGPASPRVMGLAVSMTLLLLGIFTMITRHDLISQIMGLLVMDHGLFLATVRVIPYPTLIPWFIFSLFLYILITLVILVILLPELHERSDTIEVSDQSQLRG